MDDMLKDDAWCFACGRKNPHGLQLHDIHLEDEACLCTFTPEKWHQGWAGIVHGGITSTLLDETMTHLLYRRGFDALSAEMTVRWKEPIAVGQTVLTRAWLHRMRRGYAVVEARTEFDDATVAAAATGKYFINLRPADTNDIPILTFAQRSAVIFDLFGTLVGVYDADGYLEMLHAMGAAIGMEPDAFADTWQQQTEQRMTGRWPTITDHIAWIARQADLSPTPDQLEEATRIRTDRTGTMLVNPHPDAIDTLRALRAADRPVGIISDCSPETVELWPESPLAEFIPDPLFSAEIGLRKPDERLYRMACDRIGTKPVHTVYVGDGNSRELWGARQAQILPILIERPHKSVFATDEGRKCDTVLHRLTSLLPLIGLQAAGE